MANKYNIHCDRFSEKCLDRLKSTNGPITCPISEEIKVHEPNIDLVTERPCIIRIRNNTKKSITEGLGCYYGYGCVLMALHVIERAGQGDCDFLVAFTFRELMLVYKAEINESFKFYKDKDQAFIKLLGDTRPLGDGLQNGVGKVSGNGIVYFYTLEPDGNFQKREGKICRPNRNMKAKMSTDECVMSVAGKAGDSGSPVYNAEDELIGIYTGSFSNLSSIQHEYGRFTKIPPQSFPWI